MGKLQGVNIQPQTLIHRAEFSMSVVFHAQTCYILLELIFSEVFPAFKVI